MGVFPIGKRLDSISVSIILVILLRFSTQRVGAEGQELRANFVFGDSLVDAGNNNYIVSISKANFLPYGIDFGRPTGRFTNGRTIVDIIGQQLGLREYTPPFLAPTTRGNVILQGVNYASGGGGILNETGQIFGGRISVDAQLDNFAKTRQEIISSTGEKAAMELLAKALFSVTIGSNDFINNYLTPGAVRQPVMSPHMFIDSLISKFHSQLTRLYNTGARKIIVVNVGPIGCIPLQRDANPSAGDECVAFPNQLARAFNLRLKSLVSQLSTTLEGSKFLYADVYRIVEEIIMYYTAYGFTNANSACCYAAGRFGGLIPCEATSRVCADRSKYVFWDPYHPSEATNVIIASQLMDGNTSYIMPMNIRQLLNY